MAANPKSLLTEEEYLAQERKAEHKSEYLNGEVFAMGGGTFRHASIISDFAGELRNRLRGSSCQALTQDMRVRVSSGGLYTYPDILVVCGPPEFLDATEDTLLNPVFIAEVLSDSTRDYDLGGKFELYRQIPALREYITVEQRAVHLVARQRQPDGSWLLRDYKDLAEAVPFLSVGTDIPLSEIYRRVSL